MEIISILENYFYSKDFWVGFATAVLIVTPLAYGFGLVRKVYTKTFECPIKIKHKRPTGSMYFSTIEISYRCGKIVKCNCTYRRKKGFYPFKRSICVLNNKPCIAKEFID